MANKKGFYLNDVPVDVFLDYFDKTTYAEDVENTPLMENSYDIWLVPRTKISKGVSFDRNVGDVTEKFKLITNEIKDQYHGCMYYNNDVKTISFEFKNNSSDSPSIKIYSDTLTTKDEEVNFNTYYYSGFKNRFYKEPPLVGVANPNEYLDEENKTYDPNNCFYPPLNYPELKKEADTESKDLKSPFFYYLEPGTVFEYDNVKYILKSWVYEKNEDTSNMSNSIYTTRLTVINEKNSSEKTECDTYHTPGSIENNKLYGGSYYKNVIDPESKAKKQPLTCFTFKGTLNKYTDVYRLDTVEEHYDEFDNPFIDINNLDIVKGLYDDGKKCFDIEDLDILKSYSENGDSEPSILDKYIEGEAVKNSFIIYSSSLKKGLDDRLKEIIGIEKEFLITEKRERINNEKLILSDKKDAYRKIQAFLNTFPYSLSTIGGYKKYIYYIEKEIADDDLNKAVYLYVIMEANHYSVPIVNEKGENLYKDSFGSVTNKRSYKNNFYTHQNAIRKTFSNLTKNTGWMYRTSPRNVVLLANKNREEFAFYDEFSKVVSYQEIESLPEDANVNVSTQIIPKSFLKNDYKITEKRTRFQTKIKAISEFPQYTVYSNSIDANKLKAPSMFYLNNDEERYRYNNYAFRKNGSNNTYLGDYAIQKNDDGEAISSFFEPTTVDENISISGDWPGRFRTVRGFYNNFVHLALKKGLQMSVTEDQYHNWDDLSTDDNEFEKDKKSVNKVYTYTPSGFYSEDRTYIDDDADILIGERKYNFNDTLTLELGRIAKYKGKNLMYMDASSDYSIKDLANKLFENLISKKDIIINLYNNTLERTLNLKISKISSTISSLNKENKFFDISSYDSFKSKIIEILEKDIKGITSRASNKKGFFSYSIDNSKVIEFNYNLASVSGDKYQYKFQNLNIESIITKGADDNFFLEKEFNGETLTFDNKDYTYFNQDGFYDKVSPGEIYEDIRGTSTLDIPRLGVSIKRGPLEGKHIIFNNTKYSWKTVNSNKGFYDASSNRLSIDCNWIKYYNRITHETEKINSKFDVLKISQDSTNIKNQPGTRVKYDNKEYEYDILNRFVNIENKSDVINMPVVKFPLNNKEYYWSETDVLVEKNFDHTVQLEFGDILAKTDGKKYYCNGKEFIDDAGSLLENNTNNLTYIPKNGVEDNSGFTWNGDTHKIELSNNNEVTPSFPIIATADSTYFFSRNNNYGTRIFEDSSGKPITMNNVIFHNGTTFKFNPRDGLMHDDLILREPTTIQYKKQRYIWDESLKHFITMLSEGSNVTFKGKRYKYENGKLIDKFLWWTTNTITCSATNTPFIEFDDKLYQWDDTYNSFISKLSCSIYYIDLSFKNFWRSAIQRGYWIAGDNKIVNSDTYEIVEIKDGMRILGEDGEVYIKIGNEFRKILRDNTLVKYENKEYYYKEWKSIDVFFRPLFEVKSTLLGSLTDDTKITHRNESFTCKTIKINGIDQMLFISDQTLSFKVSYVGSKNWYWDGTQLMRNNNLSDSFKPNRGTLVYTSNKMLTEEAWWSEAKSLQSPDARYTSASCLYEWNGVTFIKRSNSNKDYKNFIEAGTLIFPEIIPNPSNPTNKACYGPFIYDSNSAETKKCRFRTLSLDDLKEKNLLRDHEKEKINFNEPTLKPGRVSISVNGNSGYTWNGLNIFASNGKLYEPIPTTVKSLDGTKTYQWSAKNIFKINFFNVNNPNDKLAVNSYVLYEERIYYWNGKKLLFVPIDPKSSTTIKFGGSEYYYHKINVEGENSLHWFRNGKAGDTGNDFQNKYFIKFPSYSYFYGKEDGDEEDKFHWKDISIYWNGDYLKADKEKICSIKADESNTITINLPITPTSFEYDNKVYKYDYMSKHFKYNDEVFSLRVSKCNAEGIIDSTNWSWVGNALVGNQQPKPYKLIPGDSIVVDDIVYRWYVGFCYFNQVGPRAFPEGTTVIYDNEEYVVRSVSPISFYKKSDKNKTIVNVHKDMEIYLPSGNYKSFYTYLPESKESPAGFYEKWTDVEGSIVYSPELVSKYGSSSIPLSASEKSKPEFAILNVLNRWTRFAGYSNILKINDNDTLTCSSSISDEKVYNIEDLANLDDLTPYQTTIYGYKTNNPYIIFPVFTQSEGTNDDMAATIGKYFVLEYLTPTGAQIINGRFVSGSEYNTADITVEFENGTFTGEIVNAEDLGLTDEEEAQIKAQGSSFYCVRINLDPIESELCRKLLCEISPAEAAMKVSPITINESYQRTNSKSPISTIMKLTETVVRNISNLLKPLSELRVDKKATNENDPMMYIGETEPRVISTQIAIPQYYKDKYRISDCIYLKDFINDEVGNFFSRLEENEGKIPDNEFLETAIRVTGDDDIEQESIYNPEKRETKYLANFIKSEYFENYYSVEKPYIRKLTRYGFINGGELDQFPSTEAHPDFISIDIPGTVTTRFTVQQHYKEAGRYFEDEEAKLRGRYVPENTFFNSRKKSFNNTLKRILDNTDSEEINLQREQNQIDGFTNLYNYCKGLNYYIYNDIDFAVKKVANERPLINIEKQNYKLILEKTSYSGVLNDNEVTFKDSDGNNSTLNINSLTHIIRNSYKDDQRPLLERIVDYERFPLNRMYEEYNASLTTTNINGGKVDNNINRFHISSSIKKLEQQHLNNYLKTSFNDILNNYMNGVINFVSDESEITKNTITVGSDYYHLYFESKISDIEPHEKLTQDESKITNKTVFSIAEDEIDEIINKLLRIDQTPAIGADGKEIVNYSKWEVMNG